MCEAFGVGGKDLFLDLGDSYIGITFLKSLSYMCFMQFSAICGIIQIKRFKKS